MGRSFRFAQRAAALNRRLALATDIRHRPGVHRFEIHPRPTCDGVNLFGEMLGGTAGLHWFPTVRSAALYARHRAGMLADDSRLVVHRSDGTVEERQLQGSGDPCLAMNTTPATWF